MSKLFITMCNGTPNYTLSRNSIYALFAFILSALTPALSQQNFTDPARKFAIFSRGNVTLQKTEIEGRVAAGGDLILKGTYQIIPKQSGFSYGGIPIGLAVRGGLIMDNNTELKVNPDQGEPNYVKIGNGQSPNPLKVNYQNGNFYVGYSSGTGGRIKLNAKPSDFSNPPVSATNKPVLENIFGTGNGKIDIDKAFQELEATSSYLGAFPNNVTIRNMDNPAAPPVSGPFYDKNVLNFKPKVILNPNGVNVFTIGADVWSSFTNGITFSGVTKNQKFALIINIMNASGEVKFHNAPELNGSIDRVMFNFPDATSEVRLKPVGPIFGVIMAPRADIVKMAGADMNGQIIANSVDHNGDEIHYREFKADCICNDKTFVGGRVYDQRDNSPLALIPISLVPQGHEADTLRQYTNSNGEYRFYGVPEGDYLVQVQDEHIIASRQIFPVESSLFFTELENCEPQSHDFAYNTSSMPAIGDFVWLDRNKDGVQNEWYDANNDGKITKNILDPNAFETLRYEDWEWVDINGNGTWSQPGDEGELNKAGLKSVPPTTNITVTGPGGYSKNIIIGVDGYWRDRPSVGAWEDGIGLFGSFTATLIVDASLTETTTTLAATGKVKTFDENGNEVYELVLERSARGTNMERSARTADYSVLTPNGLTATGSVSVPDPINNQLDLGIAVKDNSMPVTLISFNGIWNQQENANMLFWSTALETNNKGFEIQHSADARQWKTLGFVSPNPAKGSVRAYNFTHPNVRPGTNFYKLKQIDLDGTFAYSEIISVVVTGGESANVYPNPATDELVVSVPVRAGSVREITLTDTFGRTVRQQSDLVSSINLRGLNSGLYLLRIAYRDGSVENRKVFKK